MFKIVTLFLPILVLLLLLHMNLPQLPTAPVDSETRQAKQDLVSSSTVTIFVDSIMVVGIISLALLLLLLLLLLLSLLLLLFIFSAQCVR